MQFDYAQRAQLCQHPLSQRIFQLMESKQSNLCVSADVYTASDLLTLAKDVGPSICMFKTHMDCVDDFTPELPQHLQALAKQHNFILFEDRKFADIGNTVKHQFAGGVHRIADWADLINAHPLPGPGIVSGLADAATRNDKGLLLIAEMSSQGHLMDDAYIHKTKDMAEQHPDFVIGFITGHRFDERADWLYLTPGVCDGSTQDGLGQRYITPEAAILERHTDIIIVGRGITQASNCQQTAEHYRQIAWQAHQERC